MLANLFWKNCWFISYLFCLIFVSSSVLFWEQGGEVDWENPWSGFIVLSSDQMLISHQLSGSFFFFKRLYHCACLNFFFRVKHGAMSYLWLLLHVIVESWDKGFGWLLSCSSSSLCYFPFWGSTKHYVLVILWNHSRIYMFVQPVFILLLGFLPILRF